MEATAQATTQATTVLASAQGAAGQPVMSTHDNGRACCCVLCGEPLRPKLYAHFMHQQHQSRPDCNPYVSQFLSSQALQNMLDHPQGLYHRLLDNRNLRKEASETWAMLVHIQAYVTRVRASHPTQRIVIIDLCCGKSLTATLCGDMFPDCEVVAVDRRPAKFLPHFDALPNVRFVQADLFKRSDLIATLLAADAKDRAPVGLVVGMHLCGLLSEAAIAMFNGTAAARCLLLSPCCLPKATLSPVVARANKLRVNQYDYWSIHLLMRVAAARRNLARDEAILSTRNAVIVAVKEPPVH